MNLWWLMERFLYFSIMQSMCFGFDFQRFLMMHKCLYVWQSGFEYLLIIWVIYSYTLITPIKQKIFFYLFTFILFNYIVFCFNIIDNLYAIVQLKLWERNAVECHVHQSTMEAGLVVAVYMMQCLIGNTVYLKMIYSCRSGILG